MDPDAVVGLDTIYGGDEEDRFALTQEEFEEAFGVIWITRTLDL